MKKFSRILLFAVLALTLTAVFAVSALATDGEVSQTTIPEGSVIEYTAPDGTVSYSANAGDFPTLVAKGGTVKLLADIVLDSVELVDSIPTPMPSITIPLETTPEITIDLNGHTLTRISYLGDYYVGDQKVANYNDKTYRSLFLFTAPENDKSTLTTKFTLTSSVGKGSVYNINAYATTKYDSELNLISREVKQYSKSHILETARYMAGADCTISNVKLYSSAIFQLISTKPVSTMNVTIDNIEHYYMKYQQTSSDLDTGVAVFSCAVVWNVNVKISNSLLYSPSINSPSNQGNDGYNQLVNVSGSNKAGYSANFAFENCDIIKSDFEGQFAFRFASTRKSNSYVTFENCRLYDPNVTSDLLIYARKGTYMTDDTSIVGESNASQRPKIYEQDTYDDFIEVGYKKTFTYQVPVSTSFQAANPGESIEIPSIHYEMKDLELTFDYLVSIATNVTWVYADGTQQTEVIYPGTDPQPPRLSPVTTTDPYVNEIHYWVNEEGQEFSAEDIAFDGKDYTFRTSAETKFVGAIKGAMFNMTFVTQFQYNLYLPVDSSVEFHSVEGFKREEGNVYINGNEYYVFTYSPSTTGASEDLLAKVYFTYNHGTCGGEYEGLFKLSALVYADLILGGADLNESEDLAIRNMVRYIGAARAEIGKDVTDERFTTLTEGLEDYGEYEGTGTMEQYLSEYIQAATFVIYNGSAFYRFNLQSDEYFEALSFTLTVGDEKVPLSIIDSGVQDDGTPYITLEGARVYDIIGELTITYEAEDISATYSILDYIQYEENNVAKALYEFGIAARAYREYLEGENS